MAWYDGIGKMAKGVADFTGVPGLWHDLTTSMSNSDPWYVDALNLGKDVANVATMPVRGAVKGLLAAGQASYEVGGKARQWIEQGILDTPLMYNKFKNQDESYADYRARVAADKSQISLGQATLSLLSPGKNVGPSNGWLNDWEENHLKFMAAGFDLFNPQDRQQAFNKQFTGKFLTGADDLANSMIIDPLTFTGFLGKGAVIAAKAPMLGKLAAVTDETGKIIKPEKEVFLNNIGGKLTKAVFGKMAMTPEKMSKVLDEGLAGRGSAVKDINFLAESDEATQWKYWDDKKVTNPDAMAYLFGKAQTPAEVVDTFKAVLLKDPAAQAAVLTRDAESGLIIDSLNDIPHPQRLNISGKLDSDVITKEVAPEYNNAVKGYIETMKEDARFAQQLEKVTTGNELMYGFERGPFAGRTVKRAQKAAEETFGQPDVQFFQKTSLHPIVKVTNFFTRERPSGKFDLNDANAYHEFNAWLTEANQLSKGTFAERSKYWADRFLNDVEPSEKMNTIAMAEQEAMSHLFPQYTDKQIQQIYAIYDSRRAKAIKEMKDQGFLSTIEGDQVIHNVDVPLVKSEGANMYVTADLRKLKYAIDAHEKVLPSLLSGLDVEGGVLRGRNLLNGLDTINDIFKTSVLLRLGYTVRNLTEAQLSMVAKGYALPAVAAAGGKAAVGRFFENRKTGFNRLIDNVKVMTGRADDMVATQIDFAKQADNLQSLYKGRDQAVIEINKRINELNADTDRLTKQYIAEQRALGNIVGPEEAKVLSYSAELKRLNAARADLESANLYHGTPNSEFVFDPSKPISTSDNHTVANRYAENEFDFGLERYLDPSGRPTPLRGVTGKPIESAPGKPFGTPAVAERISLDEFKAVEKYVQQEGMDYYNAQEKLRGVGMFKDKDRFLNDAENKFAETLRSVIKKSVIKNDMTLYRVSDNIDYHNASVGDVITEKGFTSTSTQQRSAYAESTRATKMIIKAPKGTPGLDINAAYDDLGKQSPYRHEKEALLPDGVKFKIISKKQVDDGFGENLGFKQYELTVEVVPPTKVNYRTPQAVIDAAERMKADMIDASRAGHTVLVRRENNQTFHAVTEDTIRAYDPKSLERAVFKVKNNTGTVANIRSYGKPLDLTYREIKNLPDDVAQDLMTHFDNDGAKLRDWVMGKGWQNPNDPIFNFMRERGYGRLVVPDDKRAMGTTHVVLPEYVGEAGKKKQIAETLNRVMQEQRPMGPILAENANMTPKERIQANKAAQRYRRTGMRDVPVSPYYTADSIHAMLNNGIEDFSQNIMQQIALHEANINDSANRLGALITKKEQLGVKKKLGYGYANFSAGDNVYSVPRAFQDNSWYVGRTSAEPTWNAQVGSQEMAFITGIGARSVRTLKPNDPRYFEGWSNILAMHFTNPETGEMDAVVRQILDGKSDAKIINWLKNKPEGQRWANDAWTRVGESVGYSKLRGGERDEYLMEQLQKTRGSVKLYIPDAETENFISSAKPDGSPQTAGDIQKFLMNRFGTNPNNPALNGLLVTTSKEYKDQERIIDTINRRVMRFLGSLPEDTFARHPLTQAVYEQRVRLGIANYAASKGADRLSVDELNQIQRSAREFARQEVERTLFTLTRRTGASGSQVMKLLFPFYAAYENTIQRWTGIAADNPSVVTRASRSIAQIVNSMNVVDQNGNKITDANQLQGNQNASLLVQVPQGFIDSLPGNWRKVAESAFKQIQIPLNSLDVITQGQPGNPGFGPYAVLPAYMILKDRPELEKAFKPFFPAGQPQSALDLFAPSVVRRLRSMWTQDALYVRTYNQMLRYETYNYNTGARTDQPTASEITDKTNKFFLLRALSSISMPVAISPEADFYQQQYRKFQQMYPDHQDPATGKWIRGEADAKFLEVYPDFFGATVSLSKNIGGLEPSVQVVRNLKAHSDLMASAVGKGDPELLGFLADDGDGKYTFSQAAYQWQYSHGATPGAANTFRQNRPTNELVRDANIKQGWTEYGKLMDQIEVYKTQNGIATDKDPQMKLVNEAKKLWVENMAKTNTDWYSAYISPDRGKYMRRAEILQQALGDKKWMKQNGNRPVVQSIALYLDTRSQIGQILEQRNAQGGSKSLSANSNADLAAVFEQFRSQLSLESPEFSQFINRYFPNDPVVV